MAINSLVILERCILDLTNVKKSNDLSVMTVTAPKVTVAVDMNITEGRSIKPLMNALLIFTYVCLLGLLCRF